MRLGKFKLDSADRKRYVINYQDWLNQNETVIDADFTGSVPGDNFYVDGWLIDPNGYEVIFFVSGGMNNVPYDVTVTITTTLAQIKQDFVTFVVTD